MSKTYSSLYNGSLLDKTGNFGKLAVGSSPMTLGRFVESSKGVNFNFDGVFNGFDLDGDPLSDVSNGYSIGFSGPIFSTGLVASGRILNNGSMQLRMSSSPTFVFLTNESIGTAAIFSNVIKFGVDSRYRFNVYPSGLVELLIDGELIDSQMSDIPIPGIRPLTICYDGAYGKAAKMAMRNIDIDNQPLTISEIEQEYNDLKNESLIIQTKTGLVYPKPQDLSSEEGLVCALNMQYREGKVLTDISGSGNNGAIEGRLISSKGGILFDGDASNFDAINLGQPAAFDVVEKSIVFRIEPLLDANIQSIFRVPVSYTNRFKLMIFGSGGGKCRFIYGDDLAADRNYISDDSIYINSGPINIEVKYNGNISETVFLVNGEDFGVFQPVGSYSDIGTDVLIGIRSDGVYFSNFDLHEFRFYNRIRTLEESIDYHNYFAKQLDFIDDFSDEGADGVAKLPRGWIPGTGTFSIGELEENDPVLSHLKRGAKYLICDSAGSISFQNNKAFDTWEFELYKETQGNTTSVNFISDNVDGSALNGYSVTLFSDGYVLFRTINNGTPNTAFFSRQNYIEEQVRYGFKMVRTKQAEFALYIRGGAFGENWVLVDTTGGGGTNPIVNSIYTDSIFTVLDFGIGDQITNIKFLRGIER